MSESLRVLGVTLNSDPNTLHDLTITGRRSCVRPEVGANSYGFTIQLSNVDLFRKFKDFLQSEIEPEIAKFLLSERENI